MMLLYRGQSLLDPDVPIMVMATEDSTNSKTGPMTQLWILRTDIHPFHATRTGDDFAICGDCALRGDNGKDRACYVNVQHAPANVYRCFRDGKFTNALGRSSFAVRDHLLRIGAYGDPAAVPVAFWRNLIRRVKGWTAYTHHWRTCDQTLREIAMASVEDERGAVEAQVKGWRTYRVRSEDSTLHNETPCPASDEMGHRSTCAQCLLCDGTYENDSRRSISIIIHKTPGIFTRSRQLRLIE